ncbi:iron-containing redox enzyme family protein [Agromyces arachidis]|uniref:iron-containing redox enzyme family protein n=1 Tax=Agromyces arachidis TaxID=766966 RepID=UPI00405779C7
MSLADAPTPVGPDRDPPGSAASDPLRPMAPPEPRGPLSAALLRTMTHQRLAGLDLVDASATGALARTRDVLDDDDIQLALFLLYELHYGGIADVPDAWEWEPRLLQVRVELERAFELALRLTVPQPAPDPADGMPEALVALVERDRDARLSRYLEEEATAEQVREVLVCRSIVVPREADPHIWAVPRLHGTAKLDLVEIQAARYGVGRPGRNRSAGFAATLRAVGLDDRYGAYADHVPARVFTSMNVMSLFGLHRRWRGAIVGHLAATELSEAPASRAERDHVAATRLAAELAETEPALAGDILFGASARLAVDRRLWDGVREAFERGASALRMPPG